MCPRLEFFFKKNIPLQSTRLLQWIKVKESKKESKSNYPAVTLLGHQRAWSEGANKLTRI